MSRGGRSRAEAEIERQRAAEERAARVILASGAVYLSDGTVGLLRAVLDRVTVGPEREGSPQIEALRTLLAGGATGRETAAHEYWSTRLSGSITLPVRDGMPL